MLLNFTQLEASPVDRFHPTIVASTTRSPATSAYLHSDIYLYLPCSFLSKESERTMVCHCANCDRNIKLRHMPHISEPILLLSSLAYTSFKSDRIKVDPLISCSFRNIILSLLTVTNPYSKPYSVPGYGVWRL